MFFGKRKAGQVQVQKKGLYYRFVGSCMLSGDVICRLCVRCGDNQVDLGILVPCRDGFGIDTKIPVKKIGEGKMAFSLTPKHDADQSKFVPIYPEEPFSYLSRLKGAFLEYQNGQTGIRITAGTD